MIGFGVFVFVATAALIFVATVGGGLLRRKEEERFWADMNRKMEDINKFK